MNRPRRLLLSTLVLLLLTAAALAKPTVHLDRWYSLLLQDQRAGWAHITVIEDAGRVNSASQMHITVARGSMALTMQVSSSFIETTDGKAIEATMEQALGTMGSMKQTMRFLPDVIEVTSEQGGQKQVQKHPNPAKPWMPPYASGKYAEAELAKGAKEIRFSTLDPSMGPRPVETVMKVMGQENVEVMGKIVPATIVDATVSVLPGVVTRQYVDEKTQPLKLTVTLMPGMELTMVAADEKLAKAKLTPPEMLVQTLVKPSRAIENPRGLRRAEYVVRFDSKEPLKILSMGYQQVTHLPDGKGVRIVVDLSAPLKAEEEIPAAEYSKPSPVLNHEDERIKQLVWHAIHDQITTNKEEIAMMLRGYVHDFIQAKDLSVGFATASEVARTRQGDCSEHAVLLAAMLRAAGVPSRTVTGLIYVDEFVGHEGVFGYHMWTQAWVGDRWLDVDATLPKPGFDAAHIALGHSAMADPAIVNDMVELLPLFGKLKIEVVETKP